MDFACPWQLLLRSSQLCRYALPDFATELEEVREILFKHLEAVKPCRLSVEASDIWDWHMVWKLSLKLPSRTDPSRK